MTDSKLHTTPFDVAEHLRTPEEMAAYLEACLEEAGDDAAFIARALGNIARAKGMSQIARDSGLSRESLYKALSGERNRATHSEGNPCVNQTSSTAHQHRITDRF